MLCGLGLTFRVQQFGETQVLLGDVEGLLQVVCRIGPSQFVELDQVGSGGTRPGAFVTTNTFPGPFQDSSRTWQQVPTTVHDFKTSMSAY